MALTPRDRLCANARIALDVRNWEERLDRAIRNTPSNTDVTVQSESEVQQDVYEALVAKYDPAGWDVLYQMVPNNVLVVPTIILKEKKHDFEWRNDPGEKK